MQENSFQGRAAPAARSPHTAPSSSRMLASYLTDIEQLLDEQHWDVALRDATDLPRIAVALSDPLMRSSSDEVAQWCSRWITPSHPAGGAAQLVSDRTGGAVPLQVQAGSASAQIPTAALRRLQLRRHARTVPRGFVLGPDENLDARSADSVQIGRALVEATRSWYARIGVHDSTVQSNLARLAVLR
jgi:hypothetical protein